jgi:4-amino-4-deoxy-L-arabinose transferase-like glycosyltransferase
VLDHAPDPQETDPAADGPEAVTRPGGGAPAHDADRPRGDEHGLLLEPPPPHQRGRWWHGLAAAAARLDRTTAALSSRPVLLGGLSSLVAAVALSANVFAFPRSDDTEGATALQAWSFLHGTGAQTLAGFGHVPGAPLLLAFWNLVIQSTGNLAGLFSGLTTIETGRVLMVVLGTIQAAVVFALIRRLTGYDLLAIAGALLLALSPLEIWYGRTLHPDTVAALWLTVAVALALPPSRGDRAILRSVLCGLVLGIAVTTRETAIVAVPGVALMLAAWPQLSRRRTLACAGAGLVAAPLALVLWLIANHAFFGTAQQPSFIGALAASAAQQRDGGLLSSSSQFSQVKDTWSSLAPFFIILCALATVWLTAVGRGWLRRGIGLAALAFWVLFASGLSLQPYFVVMAMPLWVIASVVALLDIAERRFVQQRLWGFGVLARAGGVTAALGLLLIGPSLPSDALAFSAQDAAIQSDLTVWLREHVPQHAAVVDNGSDRLDLQGSTLGGRSLTSVCTYYDTTCLHDPGVTTAYIVDDGELRYLAQQNLKGAAALRQLALTGELVWSAQGLSGGDFIRVLRVTLPAQTAP